MKRIILLVVVLVLLLCSCAKQSATEVETEFSFRGHKFGDSLEEVIEREGREPYDKSESQAGFGLEDYFGYDCFAYFKFENDELYRINITSISEPNSLNVNSVYKEFLQNFGEYGEPDKIIKKSDIVAVWIKGDYGIQLIVTVGYFRVAMERTE